METEEGKETSRAGCKEMNCPIMMNGVEEIPRHELSFEEYWVPPDTPSKCTWAIGKPQSESVHHRESYPKEQQKILPNILYHIGNTPMVKLNRIGKEDGLQCDLLCKCEYFNAGGSVKDRIALRMVEEAERDGRLKPGMTIIEPTSGNTGIGLALVSAVKGYRCIIVLPERMSNEKVDTMRRLGAQVIRTRSAAKFDSPDSHVGVALRLNREIPNSIILNQYQNSGNPLAHYDQTAEEILEQCDGKIDMVVIGAGTGGSMTGIGRKFKEKCPNCVIVGVEPVGSVFADTEQEKTNPEHACFEVEGVGYDFIPTVLDREIVDKWVRVCDKETFSMARRLIKEEGLLVGGTGGSNVWAALQAAKDLKQGQRCVILLPDSIRNYMTKFINDDWMAERDLIDCNGENNSKLWWWNLKLTELKLQTPVSITPSATVQDAINLMKEKSSDQLAVLAEDGTFMGIATQASLMNNLITNKVNPETLMKDAIAPEFKKIYFDTTLGKLTHILELHNFALVVSQGKSNDVSKAPNKEKPMGIVTRIDLLNFIASQQLMKNGSI